MAEYREEEYLMISGIQHFKFCRRQWALIHIEQQWAENEHTAVGELMHKKVHDPFLNEKRKDIFIVRALPVSSRQLGLSGECDVVEFHKQEEGVKLYGHRGLYGIYPIEYKKGKPKRNTEDELQLTAQVMCLEEMFSTDIPKGAIYYGMTRRRQEVIITEELRSQVNNMVSEMHQYYKRRYTPRPKTGRQCTSCSLKEICMPGLNKKVSVHEYLRSSLEELE